MSWRIVVISKRAKLNYKMGYLIIRTEVEQKIFLKEISTIIIENTAVSITSYLLSELSKEKIKVIFCDEDRNPSSEIIPYYGSHDTSIKIRNQIAWQENTKEQIWTEIVKEKIQNQSRLLSKLDKVESDFLENYAQDVKINDISNREGHAAKVYFNALFGMKFTRNGENNINAGLNYGYTILLSAFNREIVANGYLTQLGLSHSNMFNKFNLASDLMEPFRILVDDIVVNLNHDKFERKEKMMLVNLLNKEVVICNKQHYVNNAIKIYCKSIFDALEEDNVSKIRFYRNEL